MLGLGSLVAMSATVPMLVALIQPMLDSVVAEKNLELMQVILLAIIALFAVRSVTGHLAAYAINWVSSRMAMDLRSRLVTRVNRVMDVIDNLVHNEIDWKAVAGNGSRHWVYYGWLIQRFKGIY